ncbi:MAG: ABC transporter permease [Methanobrevibacter sp.]|nr:ABC transporter permease [Methanobrevibacter sp.]
MLKHRFITNFTKYRFLLFELVKRDISVKYRGSALGLLWSLLNPLLTMIVIATVFGVFFGKEIENFPVYVLTGRLAFSFFSVSTKRAMNSIKSGSSIMKKIYVPKYIYALSGVLSEAVNLLISMIVLVGVMIAIKCPFSIDNLACIIPLFLLFIFAIGCGLVLASANVFFKDVKYLYGVFTTLLMYSCAIFYPISRLPEQYHIVFYANPVYCAISGFRDAILGATFPNPGIMLYLAIMSVLALIIGITVFYKTQDKFILYI